MRTPAGADPTRCKDNTTETEKTVQKSYDWIMVGGGFKSMVAAYARATDGQSVLLIESGPALGGFMSPIKWGEFWIDKGPQFFDNFEEADKQFITGMVGEGVFEDIGFTYASFLNGRKTDGFAIPDWRARGADFASAAFADLLFARMNGHGTVAEFEDFGALLAHDGGAILTADLFDLTRKFLRRDASDLSPHARNMVTYVGRKLLFDQEVSTDLKRSALLDGLLAAQKKSISDTRYNLYPKGSNLETVRVAMDRALHDAGVDVLLNTGLEGIDASARQCRIVGQSVGYDRLFFGCDAREAEKMLFGTQSLLEQTHMLPEIFHCYTVPRDSLDAAYYLVDYDPAHLSTRMTNFSNFMHAYDAEGNGVFCVEQAIDRDSPEWDDPSASQARIFAEAREAGNVDADHFKDAKSFRIPVTYKVPLTGFVAADAALSARIAADHGDSVVVPNTLSLTRKQTLDDLRQLEIL